MGDLVFLHVQTKLDVPPERVLSCASERDFEEVVVVGFLPNGEFYFAASSTKADRILWALERAKAVLIRNGENR